MIYLSTFYSARKASADECNESDEESKKTKMVITTFYKALRPIHSEVIPFLLLYQRIYSLYVFPFKTYLKSFNYLSFNFFLLMSKTNCFVQIKENACLDYFTFMLSISLQQF